MAKERFKLIPVACMILKKDNKIFLLRRLNTGYEDGNYGLIAGGVDGNETIIQAAIREAKEEVDITLKKEDLKVVHVLHEKYESEVNAEAVVFFIEATKWEGEPKIAEPHKCDDVRCFDLGDIPQNTVACLKFVLDKISKGIFYSEFGWK